VFCSNQVFVINFEGQLVDVCLDHVSDGAKHLKIQVGRDNPLDIPNDESRIKAVREAIGDDVELSVDANEKLSINQARKLSEALEDYDISYFEEPIYGNDPELLADLRSKTSIPIAVGQNEGNRFRHRDYIVNHSVDIVQPNVCYVGGYTEGQKVAAMAQAFNYDIANGGGKAHYNAHLIAAMSNGWLVEFNPLSFQPMELIFVDPPLPQGDEFVLRDTPGLGLEPDRDAVETYQSG
jgi:L-alanine-DL-glutamate epimerase-like enolase superfamily enzyme